MTEQALDLTDEDCTELFSDKPNRWYQIAARNQTIQLIEKGVKRILIVLATGTGKTHTIAITLGSRKMREVLHIPGERPLRVLFVAHKHRLLTQAERTFASLNNVEIMPQSVMSQISDEYIKKSWDIIVLDEAQHESIDSFQYHLEKLGKWIIVGLTATPDRSSGELIKFEEIVNPISREQAVEEGWISPTNIHSFVDVSSKDKIKVLTDMFTSYSHQMGNTFVFVKTKKEVAAITSVLCDLGHKAVGLLNQTEKELNTILDDFSLGKWKFIVNCGKIGEGVDVKGCTDVVLGRQLGSYVLLNQICGRTVRPDSASNVWELVSPLSKTNLDTTCVVGTPESHRLISKEGGKWIERNFDYTTHRTNKQLGISSISRVVHR